MSQLGFSDAKFVAKRKQTRRQKFFAVMDLVIPWSRLMALIEPVYPKGKGGRTPNALQTIVGADFALTPWVNFHPAPTPWGFAAFAPHWPRRPAWSFSWAYMLLALMLCLKHKIQYTLARQGSSSTHTTTIFEQLAKCIPLSDGSEHHKS